MTAIDSIRQLYRHRVLAQVLITRELKARYRGTFFGFLWTLLNPLVLTLTYTIVFSTVLRVDMPHFYVFLLSGVLPWLCFASTLTESSMSILTNGGLIKKVALPSEMFPLVCVGTNMVLYTLGLLLVEPCSRLALNVSQGSVRDTGQGFKAYARLWKDLPGIVKEAVRR